MAKHTGAHPIKRPTVADLKTVPTGTIQYCTRCHNEYSAAPGDYFMLPSNTPLRCCGKAVKLVTRATVYTEVKI